MRMVAMIAGILGLAGVAVLLSPLVAREHRWRAVRREIREREAYDEPEWI